MITLIRTLPWVAIGMVSLAFAALPTWLNFLWMLVLLAGGAYGFVHMLRVPKWYWKFLYQDDPFIDGLREGLHSPLQGAILFASALLSYGLGLPIWIWLSVFALAQLAGWTIWYWKVYRKTQKRNKRKK